MFKSYYFMLFLSISAHLDMFECCTWLFTSTEMLICKWDSYWSPACCTTQWVWKAQAHQPLYQLLMLRSQIKLTSYDFSDLHITGEFNNRPGTGRFLRIFFCAVTYRKGAGRRLYMKSSADARCPVDFTRIFTCNDEYMYIKIRHHNSKETVC